MTLSDSDDVQTISSGSEDNKEKEKVPTGNCHMEHSGYSHQVTLKKINLTHYFFNHVSA